MLTYATYCGIIYLPVTPELFSKGGELFGDTPGFFSFRRRGVVRRTALSVDRRKQVIGDT